MKKLLETALAFAAMTSFANAQSYICDISSQGDGFIPEQLGMNLDKPRKSAVVFDAYINWGEGQPISARMRNQQDGKLELRWNLNLPTSPIRARVNYRVVFDEAAKTMVMYGNIRSATNRLAGTGTCVLGDF